MSIWTFQPTAEQAVTVATMNAEQLQVLKDLVLDAGKDMQRRAIVGIAEEMIERFADLYFQVSPVTDSQAMSLCDLIMSALGKAEDRAKEQDDG